MPGPVPNREADLARPRSRKGGNQIPVTKGEALPVIIPDPDPDWHPTARLIWDSVHNSGQKEYYQSSDWTMLYSWMEDLSYAKRQDKMPAILLQTIYSALGSLLLTEGDRRRLRIELERQETGEAEVVDMSARRKRLGVAS